MIAISADSEKSGRLADGIDMPLPGLSPSISGGKHGVKKAYSDSGGVFRLQHL